MRDASVKPSQIQSSATIDKAEKFLKNILKKCVQLFENVVYYICILKFTKGADPYEADRQTRRNVYSR